MASLLAALLIALVSCSGREPDTYNEEVDIQINTGYELKSKDLT
jgi:hypothetical protein